MYNFLKQSYDKNNTISQENLMNHVPVAIVFGYCSWPAIQQKSRLLIGLNRILLCLNNSSHFSEGLT